jgi:sporulation protein YtfJ
MQSIKEMVDVNTVVGDAVETNDGTVIIPISQVTCGFAAGGESTKSLRKAKARICLLPAAAVPGIGKTVGFLVVRMNDVRLISVSGNPLAERVVDLAPQIMDKFEAMMQHRSSQKNDQVYS